MAARAIWKGIIVCDKVRLPVKLYSAVQDRRIHFRLLHDQDLVPVRQKLVNSETGRAVEHSEARRGYPVDRDVFVMLEPDELESLQPEDSRDIEITRFVDPALINHQWYDRPYYLGPDEDDADYFAFASALGKEGKEGVARWVMRKKEYVGALRAEGDYLMLLTLRNAGQVLDVSELKPPKGREHSRQEQKMAEQLVGALEEEFRPEDFHDEHRERILELIEAKQAGRTIEPKEERPEPTEEDRLSDLLEASLAGAK